MRFYTSLEGLYKLTGISIRAMSLIYIHKARQIGGGACTEVKYTGSYKYIACNRINSNSCRRNNRMFRITTQIQLCRRV